ncbi:MAG: metal-sulfur cluster assembly factor [Anaerolineae bacterium]|nr:metal-sulfur cluster assembly factor [Gemmatimonadaceae bacterium]
MSDELITDQERIAGDAAVGAATNSEEGITEDQVKSVLRRVKDPDLNLNILDLGLIYSIRVDGAKVSVDMSLTSPGCPSGPEIMRDAEQQIRAMPGVEEVAINLVWTPFWTADRIEPRIRSYLGM